jgi:photosystem II stability/assembly factor-like uncharacterized protein
MFNLRGVVRDFEFDPQAPETVYAGNSGLYRSDDRGRRWKLIYPNPEEVIEEVMIGDHASHRFRTESGMPDSQIVKVRVDPSDGNRLFIGLSPSRTSGQPARILESKDKGVSWQQVAQLPGQQILGIFPGSWAGRSEEIVVVSDSGAVRVSLEGEDVQELRLPVTRVLASEGGVGQSGSYLYILSEFTNEGGVLNGGVYRSSDFGASWEKVNGAFEASVEATGRLPQFRTLAVSEGHADVVYLSCEALWMMENGFPQRHSGILKSSDGGGNWDWVMTVSGGRILTENFEGDWILRKLGWFRNPGHLGVSPTNPDIVYGTDSGRTIKSENGGRTWEQCIDREFEDRSFTTRGLDVTTTYGVHFDPFDPQHIFISYTDIGLFDSFNGGKSWNHAITGIPRQWRRSAQAKDVPFREPGKREPAGGCCGFRRWRTMVGTFKPRFIARGRNPSQRNASWRGLHSLGTRSGKPR